MIRPIRRPLDRDPRFFFVVNFSVRIGGYGVDRGKYLFLRLIILRKDIPMAGFNNGMWKYLTVTTLVFLVGNSLFAQERTEERTATNNVESEIGKVSRAFEDAFDAADALAIAELFTPDGEFIDVERLVYQGRDAVKAEFAATFEAVPGSAISANIDSIRLVAPNIAIEDGMVTMSTEAGPVSVSRYCAVYTKVDGAWKIASLRDLESETFSPGNRLTALQFLIGDWISESADGIVEHSYYWSDDGNFILNDFSVTVDGQLELSGNQRIGWDPQTKQIRGWLFDFEGGHVQGNWSELQDRWVVKASGYTADGTSGSSTNYFIPGENGQVVWRSTDRVVDGEPQDDIEVKLTRKPPAPAEKSPREADSK